MLRTTKTENGSVRGMPAGNPRITVYRGIPFAAPPVGKLRWRAPQPAANWAGVRDCLEFAPISMQGTPGENPDELYAREWHVDPQIPMDEDCLYLNIWTPAVTGDEKLPVFVWYFGGGFQCGYTAEMEFDGERLARRGMVVVTVNYRVNVFGFFAHPELTAEAPDAPANFGLLDQQAGLFWVKRNIAAFGGDPDHITIGGQSAGGASVMAQLNNPASAACFQNAIVQSGIFYRPYEKDAFSPLTLAETEQKGVEFFRFLGVSSLEEARRVPARDVLKAYHAFGHNWNIAIDGKFQTCSSWDAALRGALPDKPLLMGETNNEFFTSPNAESLEELKAMAGRCFGDKAAEFLALTGADEGLETAEKNGTVASIELAMRILCRRRAEAGQKNATYVYEFGPEIPGDGHGAFHSSDIWFFFETLGKCWRPFTGKHYDLARQMCNYWANFIKTGNPNGCDADGAPQEEWPAWRESDPRRMTFYDEPKTEACPASPVMSFLTDAAPKA